MTMAFPAGSSGSESPITQAWTITPDDDTDLSVVPRCLILDQAGTVRMVPAGGSTAVSVPLQAGFNPIRPSRVLSTGTTSGLTIVGGL
jgi:hypothetical protein